MEYGERELEKRDVAEAVRRGFQKPVRRLMAPPGVREVETNFKRSVRVGRDGTALFCEEEAQVLLTQGWRDDPRERRR